jgi:ABC-type Mn2+/Zn2+ transport system ATPase subunit
LAQDSVEGRENYFEKIAEPEQSAVINAVCLSQVCISMVDGTHSLLEDVNLDFRQNSFTVLVGPSRSGKSTLLKAIVSEVNYTGDISVCVSRITYCPQSPWLFTGTIRQNICGLNTISMDEEWYFSVLHCCALDAVLLTLPHGDNTRVEGQSSSLSGGQKQRIVLARVLYQRPQLLLLDDTLSALDVKTEVQIMSRLFGANGLLSRLGTTVILASHTHHWEALADSVITLDGSGKATQRYKPRQFEQSFYLDSSISSDATNSNPVGSHETKQANSISSQNELPSIESRHQGSFRDYTFYAKTVRWQALLMFVSAAGAQTICYYISQETLNWWTADNGSNERKWLPLYLAMTILNAVMYGCTVWTSKISLFF